MTPMKPDDIFTKLMGDVVETAPAKFIQAMR